MGDRASYAIREGGELSLYYGNFGAATLLADIFWGPAEAEAVIRAQEPDTEWLDDVYGEAAVALCLDTRAVAFYDCRFAAATRETAAALMRQLWPGWTVASAFLVSGVAAHVGVDLLATAAPRPSLDAGTRPLAELGIDEPGAIPGRGLIRVDAGPWRVANRELVDALGCGPGIARVIDRLPEAAEVRAARGWVLSPDRDLVIASIDTAARRLDAAVLPGIGAAGSLASLRRLDWPGWDIAIRHGLPEDPSLPADLLPPDEVPLAEQLGHLGAGLLGIDGFKQRASAWLGLPLPVDGLEPDERADRLLAAIDATGLDRAAVEAAIAERREEQSLRDVDGLRFGVPGLEVSGESAARVGDELLAVRQRLDGGVPVGGPVLIAGGDGEHRVIATLSDDPIRSPRVRGVPGAARSRRPTAGGWRSTPRPTRTG